MTESDGIAAHLASARPRALAALARYFRDLDLAEDAYQEACLRAMRRWPGQGLPRDPTAWLVLVARNAGIDQQRRARSGLADPLDEARLHEPGDPEALYAAAIDQAHLRDDVLRLLFMCCHPELPVQDQLALALKVVAGLSVAEIARAFVIRPKAMEQRITRAKKKAIAVAARLDTLAPRERAERLNAVSTMVYLLFNEGYSAGAGELHIRVALCEEAIRLARLLLAMFPGQAEVMGLLALCLLHHARRKARLDRDGALVPLDEQDRHLWEGELIAEGRVLIEKALRKGPAGPYQIQAAIAAVHCSAASPTETDWAEIERLYELLEALQPSPIVTLNRAVAVSKTEGEEAAVALLLPLAESLADYRHYHTTLAAIQAELGQFEDAKTAYRHALALAPTQAEATYIETRLAAVEEKISAAVG